MLYNPFQRYTLAQLIYAFQLHVLRSYSNQCEKPVTHLLTYISLAKSARKVILSILNIILALIGNQCSFISVSIIHSCCDTPIIKLAALFITSCSFLNKYSGCGNCLFEDLKRPSQKPQLKQIRNSHNLDLIRETSDKV